MIKQRPLKLSNLYKRVDEKHGKEKSIILILCTQLTYEFDKIECDNQIFRASIKYAINTLKKLLENMLNLYYSCHTGDTNYVQADAINDACIINESYLAIAFELAKRTPEDSHEFEVKFEELLKEFNLKPKTPTV